MVGLGKREMAYRRLLCEAQRGSFPGFCVTFWNRLCSVGQAPTDEEEALYGTLEDVGLVATQVDVLPCGKEAESKFPFEGRDGGLIIFHAQKIVADGIQLRPGLMWHPLINFVGPAPCVQVVKKCALCGLEIYSAPCFGLAGVGRQLQQFEESDGQKHFCPMEWKRIEKDGLDSILRRFGLAQSKED